MDEVEQIKERLDIVDVIGSYLTLKRAGANMKANCPFHHEKTPSFMISPEKQSFRCFGCNEGGDIFTFIEKIEGVDFYNALKILADKAGVTLQNKSVRYGEREFSSDKKTRVFEINDWAKKLYHKILTDHPKAQPARDYIFKKRRLTESTVNEFEIGYSPDSWDFLIKFLKSKGYTTEEMFLSGVVVRNEKGDFYDRFRGRIMFPINNIMGNTIAFTSRILIDDKNQAKYINSSESPIYTKGKTVYGLDKAKMAIKEHELAILVEGNMDVIACHQAGFKNVVATSGTAITDEQLKILSRYSQDIAFSFDSDSAGVTAMKKAIGLALKNDINSKIIAFDGPYKDPDEAIKADPKNWTRAVERSKPSLEYWIDLLVREDPALEISTKKKIAKEIIPIIKTIFSPIEKEYYIKYLSKKLSVSEKSLISALDKTAKPEAEKEAESEENSSKLSVEEKLLGLLWSNIENINLFKEELKGLSIKASGLKTFVSLLKNGSPFEKEGIALDEIAKLNQISMQAAKDIDPTDSDALKNEIRFLIGRVRSEQKETLKDDFARKIQVAEESGDREMVKKLLAEFSDLIK